MRRVLIAAAFCAVCGQAAVAGNGTQTVTLAAATAACAPGGTSYPVKRFNPAYACLSLGSQKAVFDVSTDTMRVVEVAGSYKAYANSTDTVTMSVDAMDGSSLDPQFATAAAKLYAFQDPNGGGRRFIPVYTAIVQAEKGIVTSVSFDEGCFLCDAMSDACVTNGQQIAGGPPLDVSAHRGCAVPVDQCEAQPTPNNPDANTCDLKLFIVWTGSDVKGEYLTSVGKRFSRFRSYGMNLGTMWGSIRGISTDAVNRLGPRPDESFRRVLRRLGQSHAGARPQEG